MSLLPLLLDLAGDPLEDAFGHGLYPGQCCQPRLHHQNSLLKSNLWPRIYHRQWHQPQRSNRCTQDDNLKKSNIGKDGFQVCMDVQHFQPNEIVVKTVDNSVLVEGKHEEKEDEHGHIYRHFVRRYELPKEYDVNDVISTLSSDGVLTIKAPPKAKAIESNERVIQIQQTGPAHLSVKSSEKEQEKVKTVGEQMTE